MRCYCFTVFWSSFLLASSAFGAGVGLNPGGISFPDGSFQSTAALPQLPPDTAWVATSGGDYTSPVDAMDHLSDWCRLGNNPAPISGRCTLLIAHGSYELLRDQQIIMHKAVDIVGMGVESTKIVGRVGGSNPDESSALILGAQEATLRDLAVLNFGVYNAANVTAIYNKHPSFSIDRVKVTAGYRTNSADNYGIINDGAGAYEVTFSDINVFSANDSASGSKKCFGIWNKGNGKLEINYAKVLVMGCIDDNTAIQNTESSLRLVNVSAEARFFSGSFRAFAVWNTQGTITVLNSTLKSSYRSLGIGSASDRIINTQLDGSVSDAFPSPSTQCRGTYDSSLAKVDC